MRIAVVSDIHGNLPALEAVLRDATRRGVDATINLGDSLSGPLLPRETAEFLMTRDWVQLAGNHERQILSSRPEERSAEDVYAHSQLGGAVLAWIASLKPLARFADDVLLCHGTPASDGEYFLETVDPRGIRAASATEIEARLGTADATLVLCGHTHTARVVRSRSSVLLVNPGSVGLPAYDDLRPYPHVVAAGSPDARYAIVERGKEGWSVALIAVPYDHRAMAELARLRGMPGWEHALRWGYMP